MVGVKDLTLYGQVFHFKKTGAAFSEITTIYFQSAALISKTSPNNN
jgi:hypothetical protein